MTSQTNILPKLKCTKEEAGQQIAEAIEKLSVNDNVAAMKKLCDILNPKTFSHPFTSNNSSKSSTKKPKAKDALTVFDKCRRLLLKNAPSEMKGVERMKHAMFTWKNMTEIERNNMASDYDKKEGNPTNLTNITNITNDTATIEQKEEKQEEEVEKEKTVKKKHPKKKDEASTSVNPPQQPPVKKTPIKKTPAKKPSGRKGKATEPQEVILEKESYPLDDEESSKASPIYTPNIEQKGAAVNSDDNDDNDDSNNSENDENGEEDTPDNVGTKFFTSDDE